MYWLTHVDVIFYLNSAQILKNKFAPTFVLLCIPKHAPGFIKPNQLRDRNDPLTPNKTEHVKWENLFKI